LLFTCSYVNAAGGYLNDPDFRSCKPKYEQERSLVIRPEH